MFARRHTAAVDKRNCIYGCRRVADDNADTILCNALTQSEQHSDVVFGSDYRRGVHIGNAVVHTSAKFVVAADASARAVVGCVSDVEFGFYNAIAHGAGIERYNPERVGNRVVA